MVGPVPELSRWPAARRCREAGGLRQAYAEALEQHSRRGESVVPAHVRQCAGGGERIERKNGKISPSCALLQDYGCGFGPTDSNLGFTSAGKLFALFFFYIKCGNHWACDASSEGELCAHFYHNNWVFQDMDRGLEVLRQAFGPSTTKTYCEDVFRDLRQKFCKTPSSQATLWARQEGIMQSLEGRDPKNILPVLKPEVAAIQRLQKLKGKRLLTQAVFSPPSNHAKVTKAGEHGQCFDVGQAEGEAKPLLELGPLLGKENPTNCDPMQPLFMMPATKESLRATASALAVCKSWETAPTLEALESKLGKCWLGECLCVGQCFQISGEYWLSLGYKQFAALLWKLEKVSVPENNKDMLFFFANEDEPRAELRWCSADSLRKDNCKGLLTELCLRRSYTSFFRECNHFDILNKKQRLAPNKTI